MTNALIAIAVAVALYLGVLATLWRFQERIVFQPPVKPESPHAGTTRWNYVSRDGIELVAHVVEPSGGGRTTIVAFHGNATIARWLIPWARELSARLGVVVVLPEYRGYDGLVGTPTYDGVALDAEAALDAVLRSGEIAPSSVVLYGHSLGTAVACEVASTRAPRALILESPFSSARDMAARWRIFGLDRFWTRISRVHYDTAARVAALASPVYVAHGERDVIIPPRMGQTVHAAARNRGALLMVPEAGHNDVAATGGDAYWRWFEEALQRGPR